MTDSNRRSTFPAARLPILALALIAALLLALPGVQPQPARAQSADVWSATLTVQPAGANQFGCNGVGTMGAFECGNTAVLTGNEFTYGTTTYKISLLRVGGGTLEIDFDKNLATDAQKLTLHVGNQSFAFESANSKGVNYRQWTSTGLSWSRNDNISLRLTGPDATLSTLSVTPGAIDPAFSSGTTSYTLGVAGSVSQVTLDYTVSDSGSTHQVLSATDTALTDSDNTATGFQVTLGGQGTTTVFKVKVTNSGVTRTYTVTVTRAVTPPDNTLSALSVTPGAIEPAFDSGTTSYTVGVAATVTKVTLDYTKSSSGATAAVLSATDTALTDSDNMAAGFQVTLGNAGTATTFKVKVTDRSISKTYTVTVIRAADPPKKDVPYNWPLIPPGLGPGDSFRLIFVTSNTRNANSGAIADYDTHVRARAAAGHPDIQAHSAHFRALASAKTGTTVTHARVHTVTSFTNDDKGVPIYWLGWRKAARDYEDFYDGVWMEERGTDEFGNDLGHAAVQIWTGSNDQGTAATGAELGSTNPARGELNKQWVADDNPLSGSAGPKADARRLYALSGVFTVAQPAPSDGQLFAWVEGMQLRTTVTWTASLFAAVTGYQVQRALYYRPDTGGGAFCPVNPCYERDPATGRISKLERAPVYDVVVPDTGANTRTTTTYDIDGQHSRNYVYRVLPIRGGVPQEDAPISARASTTVVPPTVHLKWNPNMANANINVMTVSRRLLGSSRWQGQGLSREQSTDPWPTTYDETLAYLNRPGNAVEARVHLVHTDTTTQEVIGPITVRIPPIMGERHYCVLHDNWALRSTDRGQTYSTGVRNPLDVPKIWYQLDTTVTTPVTPGTGPFEVRVLAASRSPLDPNLGCIGLDASYYDYIPRPPTEEMVLQQVDPVRFSHGFMPDRDTLQRRGINHAARSQLGVRLPNDATVIGHWTVQVELERGNVPWPYLRDNKRGLAAAVYDVDDTGREADGDAISLSHTGLTRDDPVWWGKLYAERLGTRSGDVIYGCNNIARDRECSRNYGGFRFTYDSTGYAFEAVEVAGGNLRVDFNTSAALRTRAQDLVLRIGSRSFPLKDADVKTPYRREWHDTGFVWAENAPIYMWLQEPPPPIVTVWQGRLTVKSTGGADLGCHNTVSGAKCSDASVLSDDDFTYDSTDYTITGFDLRADGSLNVDLTPGISSATGKLILRVGAREFPLQDADGKTDESRVWRNAGLTWNLNDVIDVRLMEPPGGGSLAPGDLLAPENLEATGHSDRVELTWDAVEGATGYRVLRKAAEDVAYAEIATPSTNSYTDSDVEVGRSYSYRVEAVNADGSSEPAESAPVLVLPPPPLPPTGLQATAVAADSVTLTWQAPEDESITGYMVFRLVRDADPPDEPLMIAPLGDTDTEFTDTGVEAGTAYEYRVVSMNVADLSDPATLNVDTPVIDDPLDPDDTRDGAVSLGDQSASNGVQWFTGKSLDTGNNDRADYYTFTTDARYVLGLGVRGQSIDLLAHLEDSSGNEIAVSGPPLDPNKDQTVEWLKTTIDAGTYYIRVQAQEDGQTGYYIRFGLTSAPAPANAAPEFGSSTYSFSVAEDAATGAAVGSVSATDADSDTLAYTITAGNADGRFAIDGSSGAVTTAGALDHETTASYALTVQADDGNGGTATATVNITVTDVYENTDPQPQKSNSAPEFGSSTYSFSIAEDAATGSAVGSISATDADSDTLAYTITAGNADGKFAIDGGSGAITTAGALDHETTASYALTVQADDGNGGTATATVNITVTDVEENTAPEFASATYSFSVAEDAATGSAVGSVSATDADSDTIAYTITAGNADGRFAIDGSTGAVTTAGALDHETTPSYALTVQADDGNGGTATATVNITVTDVDENTAPEFGSSTYDFSIAEDAAVGDAVGSVSATDADSDTLTYTITAGNGDGNFAIDGSTGAITTAGALDHETTSSYALTVQAADGNGGTDTATVNVTITDVDENTAPEFGSSTYSFSIAEDAATGSAVGTVSATDADSDTLVYTITAGNAGGNFAIDGSTGAVTTAGALDHETTSSYALTVQASDGNGGTATATVNVTVTDVDENTAPSFGSSTYSFSVAEDAATGAAVGSVSATDADSDTLAYTITAGNADGNFAIDGSSGAITTAGALDHETTSSYALTVQADDGNGGTATATVNITVTDVDENTAPEFGSASYSFSIAEDAATGAAVGSVSATDADSDTLAYTITAGNADGSFAIDGGSGAITTAGSLDHETTASYALTVQADDGNGGTATATVNVTVTDVDENTAPVFGSSTYSFSIAEDAATGAAVGSVSATDADSDTLAYTITAGNADGSFAIDGGSGAITTAGSLDHETTASYALTVQAADGNGGTATATVNVTVTDVDENTRQSCPPAGVDLADFETADRVVVAISWLIANEAAVTSGDPVVIPAGAILALYKPHSQGGGRIDLTGVESLTLSPNPVGGLEDVDGTEGFAYDGDLITEVRFTEGCVHAIPAR